MNIKDHRKLAQWLIASKETEAPISGTERAAFIFGNMEPDMNLFTYFRGFFHHTRMRGHNYENALEKVGKLLVKIEKQAEKTGGGSMRQFFLTGVLMHYIADAFTWPHNETYDGNLKDHVIYEGKLHQIWKSNTGVTLFCDARRGNSTEEKNGSLFVSALEYFVRQHEDYLASRSKMQDDLEYILRVSVRLSRLLLSKKGYQYECNDFIRRNYDSFRHISVVYGTEDEKRKACPVFSDHRAGLDEMPGSGRIIRVFISPYCHFFRRNSGVWHFRARQ